MPEMRCVEAVCDMGALDAAAPGAAESGDPARCAAVRGDAADDAGVAAFVEFETAWVACVDAPLPEVLPRSVLNVWLMSISCSRLFT